MGGSIEIRRSTPRVCDPTARFLTGLVGEGIAASRSPWLHESEADSHGVRLVYSLYDLGGSSDSEAALGRVLGAAKLMSFAGLNITHPYKQRVMPLLDELSEEARRIGAVNTVAIRDGKTTGFNTDYLGFAEGLRRGLEGASFGKVLQLGAGGAGAATAHALLEHGTGVLHVYDVDAARAKSLAESLSSTFGTERVKVAADISSVVGQVDGVVNATPVGMAGHPGVPLPFECLRPSLWVADIVYFPLETELLRQARAIGCRTLDGVAMVVFQAAAAFDIFTGLTADRERMLAGALEHWTS
jgi:shikimate dehydrogenase